MWLYIPAAISAPSAEQDPSTVPSDACLEALAASATWRTKQQPPSGWRRVWKKDASIRRLFGPTWRRSQEANSEAVSTWLSAHFPAKTSVAPEKARVSTERAPDSSSGLWNWFAALDPESSSWKTPQASLMDGHLTPFTAKWPGAVLILSQAAYLQPPLVRLMAEIAGGVLPGTGDRWPTPRVSAERNSRSSMTRDGHWAAPSIEQVAELSMGVLPREFETEEELTPAARRIYMASQRWATPSARDWHSGEASDETFFANSRPLNEQARRWATPNVPNGGRTMRPEDVLAKGSTKRGKRQVDIGSQATVFAFQNTHPGQTILPGESSSIDGPISRPRLNPSFEEWLMWGPDMIGWTCVCAPVTTVSDSSGTALMSAALSGRYGASGAAPSERGRDRRSA